MTKREALLRYNLIIRKLRKKPATFDEINDFLEFESELQEYNFCVSKRTFQRDLEDIRSLYDIDIQYDFSRKVYYIDSDYQTDVSRRIMEAYDTFNALHLTDRLSQYIHFESRKPQGTENLYDLLHAIKNHFKIAFEYRSFWDENDSSQRTVEPYALKEFRNRWYILAKDDKDDKIKSFALERLSRLNILVSKFDYPKIFNVKEHYKHCFGIVSPNDNKPQNIVLSFNPHQGNYIKSLPLHMSQKILVDNEEELRIQLKLFLTYDFMMEVLSFGENVKVIQPESFKDYIRQSLQAALEQY